MNNNYEDIINLSRPISQRKPMNIESRAAQFAPFSALVGYDEQVKEVSRITSNKIILDEEKQNNINYKLKKISNNLNKVNVKITYFEEDKKKSGGKYIDIVGIIKKIDTYNNVIVFNNNISINIKSIIDIEF